MVTPKGKPVVDAQKMMIKEPKHDTTGHSPIKEDSREEARNRELENSQKTISKMAVVNPYSSIIALT